MKNDKNQAASGSGSELGGDNLLRFMRTIVQDQVLMAREVAQVFAEIDVEIPVNIKRIMEKDQGSLFG